MKKYVKILIVSVVSTLMLVSALALSACTCKHEWSEWTTLTAATCETEGVMTRSCSKCGNIENKKVDALGHVEVADEALEATCTKTGKPEGKHCSRCEKILVKQEEIKALGHDFANYIYNNDATCLTDGTKTAKCSRCNETDTVKAENTAKGHDYGDWTTLVAATCETDGILTRRCAKCGNTEIKKADALGHEEVTDVAVEATCTTTGLTEGKHCSRCGKVLVRQEETSTTGHKNKNGICLNCNEDISTKGLEYLELYFEGEENKLELVGIGTATDNNIIIPAVYNGKKVVSIGEWCFKNKTNIASVDIPDSITSIGYGAFQCCRLTNVTIPNSVTSIGAGAFYNCKSLTSITIPDSVTSIGEYAFQNCSSLASITIPDGVTSIGDSTFNGCSSLTSATIPDSVTSIGAGAFSGCNSLTSINIPDSATTIGNSAFV